jgi:hypothetical protein
MRRYTRQVRLAEVGEEGQERLADATIELRTREGAAAIERRYLEAAGAGRVVQGKGEHTLPFDVRDEAAREVALGAHAALASLRAVWLKTS